VPARSVCPISVSVFAVPELKAACTAEAVTWKQAQMTGSFI
jgi:hypothetical protein